MRSLHFAFLSLLLFLKLIPSNALANECIEQPPVEVSQEEVDEIYLNSKIEFCFNKFLIQDDFYLSTVSKRLKYNEPEAFTSDQCIKLDEISEESQADALTLIKTFGYQSSRPQWRASEERKLKFESSENDIDRALKETLVQVAAGSTINERLYAGQHDKKLHSNYGGAISLAGSSLGYFVVKNSNYSKKQSEQIVRYSGPLASLTIGILKEVLYDARNRDSHTVDKHDALATAIGGGIIPIRVEFKF